MYTEGIEVKCSDEDLNAKLYNNRASAHYHLGKVSFIVISRIFNTSIPLAKIYLVSVMQGLVNDVSSLVNICV